MKKLFLLTLLLFPFLVSANELVDFNIDWYKIKTIKIVKNSWYKLIVWVSEKWESLESMVKRYWWVSWVNWAYFCPADYKECNGVNKTFSDRFSNWYDWSITPSDTGTERVVFALDKLQNPFLYQSAHDYSNWRNDEFLIWKTINLSKAKDIYNWIGNFPLLLENGESKVNNCKLIDSKMKAKSLKNFICASADWNTIFLWWVENISIYDVPQIIKKIDCYNAINLDSGGSTSMIFNNKYIKWPGRNIMDAWIIVPDKNYPIKSVFSDIPEEQKIIAKYKEMLNKKFISLDDFTRKQRLYTLSSRLSVEISKFPDGSKKKSLQLLKKAVDSYIE